MQGPSSRPRPTSLPRAIALVATFAIALLTQNAQAVPPADAWPEGIGPAPSPIRPREVEHQGLPSTDAAPEAAPFATLGTPSDCPHDFDVLHYDLTFEVDRVALIVIGTTKIRFRAETNGLAQIDLSLRQLTVSSVMRGLTPLAFGQAGQTLTVTLDAPMALGDTAEIAVAYSGAPFHESFGGFNIVIAPPFTDYALGVGLTSNPPSMGRTWFPCFDSPCDKATAEFHVKSTLAKTAVANGELVSVDVDSTNGFKIWNWRETHPIATYLMAVSIARYDAIQDPTYSWIKHYVHNTISGLGPATFANVDDFMTAFVSRFGPYPWDRFGYVTTNVGDMEHQTCVFHQYSLVDGTTSNDDILAHEMAHQWWGDLVTYADWREIWLSEGFATYGEAIAREALYGPANFHAYVTNVLFGQYLAFSSALTYPIYDPVHKWGTISYEKGGSVLHMLRHVVGDSLFWDGLAAYRAAHGGDVATTEDLRAAFESVYGSSLDWFFQEWIYSGGHPKFDWGYTITPSGPGSSVAIRLRQTQTVGPVFTMPIDFKIQTTAGDTVVTGLVDAATEDLVFTTSSPASGVVFDPDDWVLEEHTQKPVGVLPGSGDDVDRVGFGLAGPNPSRGAVSFRVHLPDARPVRIDLYAVDGRLVRTLGGDARLAQGDHLVDWDGRDGAGHRVASGVYMARLAAGDAVENRRVTLYR